ncbi:MAG TPA: hypothetical protein VK034_08420, partial [Enhygromyxa sp.]|nr:hypothetical protein [Enhygromyxa sp.]
MTTRLLSTPLFVAATILLACDGCNTGGPPDVGSGREPYVDEWVEEIRGPAAQIKKLSIGDRLTSDNFANRGNIEV